MYYFWPHPKQKYVGYYLFFENLYVTIQILFIYHELFIFKLKVLDIALSNFYLSDC